jgi:hypothetical protein
MKTGFQRPLTLGLWALVVALALRLAIFSIETAARLSNGFAAHYTASRLLLEGAPVARFYDDIWFAARIGEHTGDVYDLFYPNVPPASLVMLPVAGLNYAGARVVWIILSLAVLVAALWWLIRSLGLRGPWAPALVVLALLFQPLYEQIHQGQVYLVMLGLLVLAWHGYRREHPARAGVALGLTLGLKLLGAYLWPLVLLERRWRILVWGAGTAIVICLASLPWLGMDAWRAYFALLPGMGYQPDLAVTAYQTQAGFIRHLLAFDPRWNPTPLLDIPSVASALTWTVLAAVLGMSLYAARWARGSDLPFAMLVMANLIVGPLSVDYQYTVMLLPIALMLGWMREQRSAWVWLIFLLGVGLIAADLPYRSPRLSSGALALLAYPKLYGAWLLWDLALWGCQQEVKRTASSWIRQAQPSIGMET